MTEVAEALPAEVRLGHQEPTTFSESEVNGSSVE